ncbi:MAG: redoxin domain-containing protein [Chloroflexi bacterium]|nr:redoxin domain-containing protein [Chloroflexota bacterium]
MQAELQDLGVAPELTNVVWLNAERPLRLADLRGKVVLLEMWTFGCINCQNVLPALKRWHAEYAGQGLVVIGNHYPEFGYEADLDNLKQAVARFGIEYPVAIDNDWATWDAYRTRYWRSRCREKDRNRYCHSNLTRYRHCMNESQRSTFSRLHNQAALRSFVPSCTLFCTAHLQHHTAARQRPVNLCGKGRAKTRREPEPIPPTYQRARYASCFHCSKEKCGKQSRTLFL